MVRKTLIAIIVVCAFGILLTSAAISGESCKASGYSEYRCGTLQ